MLKNITILWVVLIFTACQNNTKKPVERPITPEEVVRQWQYLIDNNQFAAAKEYSTENTIKVIESFESYFSNSDESFIDTTVLKQVICIEKDSVAKCYYEFEEDGELFKDSFLLARKAGRWLVDVEEATYMDDMDLEEIFDGLQDVFEEEEL